MVWLQPYVVTPDDDNDLYMIYVDFLKAYDTVIRRILYYVLREKYGIPDNIVDLIIELHEGLEITPRVRVYVWKWFSVGVGRQQGGYFHPIYGTYYCTEPHHRGVEERTGQEQMGSVDIPL